MPAKVHAQLKVLRDNVKLLKAEGKGQVGQWCGFYKECQHSGIEQEGICVGSE